MEPVDDDDVKLLRASAGLVDGVKSLLERILWKSSSIDPILRAKVHRVVKERELDKLILLIEPFQEDPQLLDSQLKYVIPQLVTAYLESIRNHPIIQLKSGHVTVRHAICRVLYTFCKVRGEKVIVGFFNNEPRYVEPLLAVFERGTQDVDEAESEPAPTSISWEERFILLLWLAHLMLAPFDLSTISSFEPKKSEDQMDRLKLPADLPGIPLRIIPICLHYLRTATKERTAASQLLVRTCLRPDMRKIGLLDAITNWALTFPGLSNANSIGASGIHFSLGILSTLSGFLASGNQEEIGHFIGSIFHLCQNLMADDKFMVVRSSAVARKTIVNILRNIVVHCLKAPPNDVDTTEILEEVIGLLLGLLSDGDTPVRYAASKALSVLTLQLDNLMASEVIEAILGSLAEDVLWEGSRRNLAAVNPLRWHGLTLTLGHLLYRRAVPTQQLPEILNALLLALTFEQRSATGSSVGTNVRDAANFGIWSISRRYTTNELLAVQTSTLRAAQDETHALSIPQLLAIELIESACLDPAGNIRRGSSAALQELIGRHPDTIVEGIPLVQIVDFHAVGLRQRAMTDVAFSASRSSPMYWNSLFHSLLGWRGIAAVDAQSRAAAAKSIGLLSSNQPFDQVAEMIMSIRRALKQLAPRQVEERHGLMLALAEILNCAELQYEPEHLPGSESLKGTNQHRDVQKKEDQETRKDDNLNPRSTKDMKNLSALWSVFGDELLLQEKDFISPVLRPEFTATATLRLIRALSKVSWRLRWPVNLFDCNISTIRITKLLNYCLLRSEDAVLQEIPSAVRFAGLLLAEPQAQELAYSWISNLDVSSRIASSRSAGRVLALGTMYGVVMGKWSLECKYRILDCLTSRCTAQVGIEERVIAIRSLKFIVEETASPWPSSDPADENTTKRNSMLRIAKAVRVALNDYTINERGDVGSLVRLEALDLVETAWRSGLLRSTDLGVDEVERGSEDDEDHGLRSEQPSGSSIEHIRAAVLRLSLEKLDKVRMRAAQAAQCWSKDIPFEGSVLGVTPDVSSETYFSTSLSLLDRNIPALLKRALLEGIISSAGMGSESVVQASRLALYNCLELLDGEDKHPVDSLLEVGNTLSEILSDNLTNDRILLPLLETISFLLDMQLLQRLAATNFKWRTFLSLVQKSHYKSNNMQKLFFVLDVYRGLADVDVIRKDVLTKVYSMLLHPFPKIRTAAAETLFVIEGNEELKHLDWTQSTKTLKDTVDKIRQDGS